MKLRRVRVKRYIRKDGKPVRAHTRHIQPRKPRQKVVVPPPPKEQSKEPEPEPIVKEKIESAEPIEEIKLQKQELEKTDPSYARVKSFLCKLREKDVDIYKNILEVLKNPTIVELLSESAKKELNNL